MDSHGLPRHPADATFDLIVGTSTAVRSNWIPWKKPRGKTMVSMFVHGNGGNGGNGLVGAAGSAGGGGGGSAGCQTVLTMPLAFLPDTLWIMAGGKGVGFVSSLATLVATYPMDNSTNALHLVAAAKSGQNGGNGGAAVGGTAGASNTSAVNSDMSLGWPWLTSVSGGMAGAAGGLNANGTSLQLVNWGLRTMGGMGGGGLPTAGNVGKDGGGVNFNSLNTFLAPHAGGAGGATATTPPDDGRPGYDLRSELGLYWFPGTGGGSSHGSATGAGLKGGRGGDGGLGCGGGGGGGALTGSAQGLGGDGGAGFVVLICW